MLERMWWKGLGLGFLLHSWWECKLIQPLWINPGVRKIPWRRKWQPTSVFLPGKSHGRRSLVGYTPWGTKRRMTERLTLTHTPVFDAARVTTARTWRPPTCPSADECIKKLWYIYTMEYYSVTKRNGFESVELRCTEWSKSEREKQIACLNTYVWNLEKWYLWTYLRGRNGDTDREQTCRPSREREGGTNWKSSIEHIHCCCC